MSKDTDNSNVVEFKGDYTQPPHVAKMDLFGCEACDGFTFLLRANGEVACASCGQDRKTLRVTYTEAEAA